MLWLLTYHILHSLGIPHGHMMISHDHVVCPFHHVVCLFEKIIPYDWNSYTTSEHSPHMNTHFPLFKHQFISLEVNHYEKCYKTMPWLVTYHMLYSIWYA